MNNTAFTPCFKPVTYMMPHVRRDVLISVEAMRLT